MTRLCFYCAAPLTPFSDATYTAHEFKCGKKAPELVPLQWRDEHNRTLKWERASAAGKRGAATRRRNKELSNV